MKHLLMCCMVVALGVSVSVSVNAQSLNENISSVVEKFKSAGKYYSVSPLADESVEQIQAAASSVERGEANVTDKVKMLVNLSGMPDAKGSDTLIQKGCYWSSKAMPSSAAGKGYQRACTALTYTAVISKQNLQTGGTSAINYVREVALRSVMIPHDASMASFSLALLPEAQPKTCTMKAGPVSNSEKSRLALLANSEVSNFADSTIVHTAECIDIPFHGTVDTCNLRSTQWSQVSEKSQVIVSTVGRAGDVYPLCTGGSKTPQLFDYKATSATEAIDIIIVTDLGGKLVLIAKEVGCNNTDPAANIVPKYQNESYFKEKQTDLIDFVKDHYDSFADGNCGKDSKYPMLMKALAAKPISGAL